MLRREIQGDVTESPRVNEAKVQELIPPVDVYENGEGYLLQVDLPGASDKDVNLSVEQGKISLEARFEHPHRGPIAYRRQFALPSMIDTEKVQANLTNGVLTLQLPKDADSRETRIKVKGA